MRSFSEMYYRITLLGSLGPHGNKNGKLHGKARAGELKIFVRKPG